MYDLLSSHDTHVAHIQQLTQQVRSSSRCANVPTQSTWCGIHVVTINDGGFAGQAAPGAVPSMVLLVALDELHFLLFTLLVPPAIARTGALKRLRHGV